MYRQKLAGFRPDETVSDGGGAFVMGMRVDVEARMPVIIAKKRNTARSR
jgi:hypothetical protein